MVELTGIAALLVVAALLLAGVWRQCVPLSSRADIFDALGILPQWKFFAQAAVGQRDDNFDDLHLLARLAGDGGAVGPWQRVFAHAERRWTQALWNPHMRSHGMIGGSIASLVELEDKAGRDQFHSSLHYLTLLRHCLDKVPPGPVDAVQFAIIATRGRGAGKRRERPLFVRYVSAWHRS